MKQSFERAFGVPCFVDHGYNCFVLAEQVFGYGRGLRSFIGVLLGTGMSAGFVINGEVYRGADSLAGEFGHTCIDERGPLCACGNRGCLEALASGSAIAAAARKARDGADGHDPTAAVDADSDDGARAITAETVAAAARAGDAASREIYARMGSVLGVGISNLISTFNPEAIILGGRVSKAADLFLPSCMEVVRRRAWHASTKQVKVSQLERGQALGAAALVLQQLFTSGLILRRGADPAAPRKRSSPSSKPSSKARARGA